MKVMKNKFLYEYVFNLYYILETGDILIEDFWNTYDDKGYDLFHEGTNYYSIKDVDLWEDIILYKNYKFDICNNNIYDDKKITCTISKTFEYNPTDTEKENIKKEAKKELIINMKNQKAILDKIISKLQERSRLLMKYVKFCNNSIIADLTLQKVYKVEDESLNCFQIKDDLGNLRYYPKIYFQYQSKENY